MAIRCGVDIIEIDRIRKSLEEMEASGTGFSRTGRSGIVKQEPGQI